MMKRGILLLGLMLSVALAIGQDFYTIQVRSLSRETPLSMEELQAGMWQHKVGSQTKCFMGRFETYEDAKTALVPLKKVGKYVGAFVVSSDKIFSAGEETNDEAPISATSKVEDVKVSQLPPSSPVNNKTIKVYTIQIAAYRYPLYTKEFNVEQEVMEFYCSDNIYRYTVGKITDESEARKVLKKIKESGYPDAFLIDYKKYEVYRIE